jgi:hypothetical protein
MEVEVEVEVEVPVVEVEVPVVEVQVPVVEDTDKPAPPLASPPTAAPTPTPASPSIATPTAPLTSPPPTPPPTPPPMPRRLTPGRASRLLRERCPACFGLEEWGRDLETGGDVILGADGCFSYRHLRSAGDGPIGYDPSYFISAEKVAQVQERVAKARKSHPKRRKPEKGGLGHDCGDTWTAANENKKTADPKRYDASGIFAMTCRHSQVLFLANIDTPGEQQHYLIALLEELKEHLPEAATVLQAYDIACVLARSINLVRPPHCKASDTSDTSPPVPPPL